MVVLPGALSPARSLAPSSKPPRKAFLSSLALPLRDFLRNRWVGLAAASWVEACAGLSYMFSLYSQSFRHRLGYSQTRVDLVGMAKDIGGSFGIFSGILSDVAPPWVVLATGAVQCIVGYGGLWLTLSGRTPAPPLLLVMGLIAIGTNSATFFNTGGMITCVKNFPYSRGPIVGLLKGFMGLSGALFTQLYLGLYAPDSASFLLLAAWFPALVIIVAMPAIHLLPRPSNLQPQERANLLNILWSSCALALLLLGTNLLQHFIQVPRSGSLLAASATLLVLASPVLVGLKAQHGGGANSSWAARNAGEQEMEMLVPQEVADTQAASESGRRTVRLRQHDSREAVPAAADLRLAEGAGLKSSMGHHSIIGPTTVDKAGLTIDGAAGRPKRLEVGDDHTIFQATTTVSFWLLCLSMTGASGSGLTAMNNLGQFGQSLGYSQSDIAVAVSLMSIWNFMGRVGAAYVSEHFLLEKSIPRPAFMCITQLIMACGHVLFAFAPPSSLLLGSATVGFAYGAQWGLMPAVASEVFGLEHFSIIYNVLTMTNPMGSYLFSVCVAGHLYDIEAGKQDLARASEGPAQAPLSDQLQPATCVGVECFKTTFFVMCGACLVASCMSLALCLITAKFYAAEVDRRKSANHHSDINDG